MAGQPALAPLRVQLLGRFEVWRQGAPIPAADWRGQKTRDLLKILLLADQHFVAKDQLLEWLWPGAPPETAEAALRSAVSDLRRALEPALAHGRDSTYVQTRREGYCFNTAPGVTLDTQAFERALQSAERAPLAAALAQYPGELLEEDPYAEWAAAERDRLRGLRLEALARLAELCLDAGDWPSAIHAAEQGLALDSGREVLWRALMRAHLGQGDRAAALAAFDRCRAALARDLGTDPLPETLALHQHILQMAPAAPSQPTAQADRIVAVAAPPVWLRRLAGAGIGAWVVITAAALALSVAGVLQGSLISPGDAGAEALPRLLANPAARAALAQQWYLYLPFGLLLLPAYLAWFGSLRVSILRASAARAKDWAGALAWIGLALGGLDLVGETLSRAITAAQVSVLPVAYVTAAAEQRPVLEALWDVLRQLAGLFGTASATAQPLALACLCMATLALLRARAIGSKRAALTLRGARLLAGSGLALAVAGLLYTFVTPPIPAAWWLPLGLGLAALTYAWWLGLAAALIWPVF